MKKETFESKLKSYIALTASILAVVHTKTNAQIIYTDILPDQIIDNSFFNLDLNNDGVFDFKLNQNDYQFNNSGSDPLSTTRHKSNFVEGYGQNRITATMVGPFPPAQLTSGELISSNNNFIQSGFLFFEYHTFKGTSMSFHTHDEVSGVWGIDSVHFLGLKLIVGSNNYYGWARIKLFYDKMAVNDYAYNAFPNQPIIAGEGIINSVPDIENNSTVTVYPNPATDYLTVQFNKSISEASVTLTNILGEVVQTQVVSEQSGSNNLRSVILNLQALPSGIYFMRVQTDAGVTVKKIVKQ